MTYKEYWYASPYIVKFYAEADKLRQERFSQEAWLQGFYNCNAVSVAIGNAFGKKGGKKIEYMAKPIRMTPLSEAEKQREIEAEKAKIAANFARMANAQKLKRKEG